MKMRFVVTKSETIRERMKTVIEMFLNTFLDFLIARMIVIRVNKLKRVPTTAKTVQIITAEI